MWKANDTDELRESLAGSRNAFAITASVFVVMCLWKLPPLEWIGLFFLLGMIWTGIMVAGWRRRIPIQLGWMLMLLLVPYHIFNDREEGGISAAAACLFLAVSVVHGILYFCRDWIVKYARLEPALEL